MKIGIFGLRLCQYIKKQQELFLLLLVTSHPAGIFYYRTISFLVPSKVISKLPDKYHTAVSRAEL